MDLPDQALLILPILAQRLSDDPGRAAFLATHNLLGTSVPHLASEDAKSTVCVFCYFSVFCTQKGLSHVYSTEAWMDVGFFGPYFLDHEM